MVQKVQHFFRTQPKKILFLHFSGTSMTPLYDHMWHTWHHHMALVMLAYVLAEMVRRLCQDALPLMSFNDVVFVAVQVRMPPNPDAEDMLGGLLALLRRRQEERSRSMEWKSVHYNANS